jgi:hypothetical protein
MGRLANIGATPTLIEYAQGAAQSAMSKVADFLAPTVPVGVSVGKFKQYSAKNRFYLPDTKRAVGGRAVEVAFDASDATFSCVPNAIDVPVDVLEQDESTLMPIMMEAADLAAEIGALSHEKTVIDTAVAALTAVTPSFGSSADPIKTIDEYILTVLKAARYGSLLGVRLLIGADLLANLKNHPQVKARIVTGKGANGVASVNEAAISQMLIGQPEVRGSFMVYDAAQAGKTDDISFLLGSSMIIFAAKDAPTRMDPSFMKTFRLRNRWMQPGTYQRDDGRAEVAKFDWSADVKVTNSDAAILVTPTF